MRHINKNYLIAVFLLFCFASCKKSNTNDPVTPNLSKPNVKFTVSTKAPKGDTYVVLPRTNFIDSNFYFKNLSDSSASVTYKWDFGDGGVSTVKNPAHKYSKRGKFKVVLLVNRDNKSSDTLSMQLSVILGQKIISYGESKDIKPIEVLPASDNGFLILGLTTDANASSNSHYFLMKTDSLFNQLSTHDYAANYSFGSFQALNDGNFLLAGSSTSGSSVSNELFKISADGSILWSKTFSNTNRIIRVQQISNGDLLIVAENSVILNGYYPNRTNIIKADGSGNQLWSKLFDGSLIIQFTNNVSLETDGIVFAGSKPTGTPTAYADSLIIVKLDYNGNVINKNTSRWNVPNYAPGDIHIAKTSNGNYNVITAAVNYGLYISSPQGVLQGVVKFNGNTPVINYATSDGNMVVLQTDYQPSSTEGRVSKLNTQGVELWHKDFDDYLYITGAVSMHEYVKDKNLILGYQYATNVDGFHHHYNILLLELDKNGFEL